MRIITYNNQVQQTLTKPTEAQTPNQDAAIPRQDHTTLSIPTNNMNPTNPRAVPQHVYPSISLVPRSPGLHQETPTSPCLTAIQNTTINYTGLPIEREDAEDILRQENAEGCFLIRKSTTIKGQDVLSLQHCGTIYHVRILKTSEGKCYLSGCAQRTFNTVQELVSAFMSEPFRVTQTKAANVHVRLRRPSFAHLT
eukprot:comp17405_c0_seq1/m.16748 comp17405_c0_seq1/g.16748  ORF comp17405_c0_seq1/g.16748 comp17405_c0_seq1/m.16748 type:complete len:196 (-) comp17405_c0_seq1:188-775(-)